MDKISNTPEWKISLINTYKEFVQHMIEILPQIVGAAGLLALGFIVAHILRLVTGKAMSGVDVIIARFTKSAGQRQDAQQRSYAVLISKIVFWFVLLFFIAAASNLLGWELFAGWMDSLVRQLPNLFMGVLIILAGFIVGGSVHNFVHGLFTKAGASNVDILAFSSKIIVILTTVIIGIEQMGVQVGFLTTMITAIAGILLAGACLASGLGAKSLVANIIGAQFARKHCRIGETLKIAGTEGSILDITQTSIVLETAKGRSIVPAKLFQREISYVEEVES